MFQSQMKGKKGEISSIFQQLFFLENFNGLLF